MPGVFNPADLRSRGLSPDALVELREFNQGPQFLLQNVSSWSTSESIRNDEREEDVDVNLVDFEPGITSLTLASLVIRQKFG